MEDEELEDDREEDLEVSTECVVMGLTCRYIARPARPAFSRCRPKVRRVWAMKPKMPMTTMSMKPYLSCGHWRLGVKMIALEILAYVNRSVGYPHSRHKSARHGKVADRVERIGTFANVPDGQVRRGREEDTRERPGDAEHAGGGLVVLGRGRRGADAHVRIGLDGEWRVAPTVAEEERWARDEHDTNQRRQARHGFLEAKVLPHDQVREERRHARSEEADRNRVADGQATERLELSVRSTTVGLELTGIRVKRT